MSELVIRTAHSGDLKQLTELYNHYVRETAITFDTEPFSVDARRPWFEQFAETGPYRLLVAEQGGRVLGYACSSRFRPKAAYATSVEVSVYLEPDATGRGLAGRLYAELFAGLEAESVHRAYAGITLPNPASVALHRKFGFRPVGVYREVGRKLGRYWDVEWFEKSLDPGG